MLKTINQLLISFCLAALFAVLIGSLPSSTHAPDSNFGSHEICQQNEATKKEECASYSLGAFLFIEIGKTLNDYGVAISAVAAVAVALFTFTLWRSTDKLWQASKTQSEDMQANIAETRKSAIAMEDVAASLKINAEKIIETVEINRGIAERQKLVGELQTRAYVAINFIGVVPQDRAANYRFEPRLQIVGNGLTPAYRLRSRIRTDVMDFPLSASFNFPVAEQTEEDAVGMLGPRNNFVISASLPRMYSDEEIAEFKAGGNRRIFVWGIINYDDAFGNHRYLKYCQSVVWMADGIATTSFNTPKYNEAD